jgi:phosphate transport system substrate-binding protein
MRLLLIILFQSFLLLGCNRIQTTDSTQSVSEQKKLQGSLKFAGAFALAPFIQVCADSFRLANPDAVFQVNTTGHDSAIFNLESGNIDMAMISRKLGEREERDYFAMAVAKTGIVLIFNSHNPFKNEILTHGFTISDLQIAFSGNEILFWDKKIKLGKNTPVNVYIRKEQSGAAEVLADFLFMNPSDFKGIEVTGENEMIAAIQKDSLGLGFCNINDAFDLNSKERLPSLEFLPLDLNMNGSIEDREKICSNLDDFQNSLCHNI